MAISTEHTAQRVDGRAELAMAVKLVLLGVAVFAATRLLTSRGPTPRWLQVLGYVLLPVLVIGGAAFVVSSDALNAVLTASLLLLLLWVAAVTIAATRRSPDSLRGDARASQ